LQAKFAAAPSTVIAYLGLISYGTSLTGVYRQVGIYAGRILKAPSPPPLAFRQTIVPTRFSQIRGPLHLPCLRNPG
jgi:hypothetical protein